LDWDKPLSEQSLEVQQAFNNAMEQRRAELSPPDDPERWLSQLMTLDTAPSYTKAGGSAKALSASFPLEDLDAMRETSLLLNRNGIPGIRYLDGGSRSAGAGTHNYVTFDDSLVNILERNGQPVTAPQPGLLGKMVAPQDEALRVAQANAAKPVSEGGLGLRPDNTPEERAAAMGFDTDAYHGTDAPVERFDPSLAGSKMYADWGQGAYLTPSSFSASNYAIEAGAKGAKDLAFEQYQNAIKGLNPNSDEAFAALRDYRKAARDAEANASGSNVMPLLINTQNELRYNAGGMSDPYIYKNERMAENGKDIATITGAYGGKDGVSEYVVFDPRRIRSRFAAFDPMRRDSSDLLAGFAPLGLVPWLPEQDR
jgi:hypothetical protein